MLRPVGPQDVRFLRDMLRHAYHWRLAQDPDLPVYRYVANWGRAGDAGLITFDATARYGAAWYRLFPADEPGFGFVDEQTPELTIAVVPGARGRGVGHELIDALLDQARADGHAAISLSTEPDRTEFYERHGFEPVREDQDAVTMRAEL
jgi:GNAT superfamily N-acetyltransferase